MKIPNVAQAIKRLREERKWSQVELARRSGLTQSALSQIEAGKGVPSLQTMAALSDAFGISVAALLSVPEAS